MCIRDRGKTDEVVAPEWTNALILNKVGLRHSVDAHVAIAVSYTHLDVYKRQVLNSHGGNRNIPNLIYSNGSYVFGLSIHQNLVQFILSKNATIFKLRSVQAGNATINRSAGTVSYTQLDV